MSDTSTKPDPVTITLADLAGNAQWVAWRNEQRGDDVTKVPYTAANRLAEADNPTTWLPHDEAVLVSNTIVNGAGGGVGIELGQCGPYWIVGNDLDTCRDPVTGVIEPWATEVIQRLDTYTEISPSGTGVKQFFLVDPAAVPELRTVMGTQHGRQFKRTNGSKHPPAIELYTSHRYFAVTWQGLSDAPTELRTMPLDDLRWLIKQAGPAFAGKTEEKWDDAGTHGNASSDGDSRDPSILVRLDTAAKHNQRIAAAIVRAATLRGGSRSEGALGLGAALKRVGWTFDDMKAALLACPATREWATEHQAEGDRQFERIWAKANERPETPGPDAPDTDALLECVTLDPIGKANLPPRPWAYGHFLLFGTAAVLAAVDGGGKGVISVAIVLAMITGKPLLGERVWRAGPVVIVTFEDDETEWHRRIAAGCDHYELDYEFVMANVHFLRKPGGRVSFASPARDGIVFPDSKDIIKKVRDLGAVLLVIDPFNHAHSLDDGNSNAMIAKVAGEISRIAQESSAAVLLLHHLRKGSSGQVDDLMGATSLRATFRGCRILQRMTPEVAESLKITDAWRYLRIAGTKENYAPPPEKAGWLKLVSVRLGNTSDPLYPDGDDIAVATTWTPRPIFEGMDAATIRAVFNALRDTPHSPSKQTKHTPWAGVPLVGIGGRNEQEAGKIVKAWLASKTLTKEKYYHNASKNSVERVVLDEAMARKILAPIEGFQPD